MMAEQGDMRSCTWAVRAWLHLLVGNNLLRHARVTLRHLHVLRCDHHLARVDTGRHLASRHALPVNHRHLGLAGHADVDGSHRIRGIEALLDQCLGPLVDKNGLQLGRCKRVDLTTLRRDK